MAYTKPTISNYNDNPPTNDGSRNFTDNGVDWDRHIDEIGDPIKNYIDAVNNETDSTFDDLIAMNPANVKDSTYGATGDGVTDDRAAIQACINANLLVYFPPGTYIINGGLTLPALTVLYADGMYGNSDTNDDIASAKLIFTGTADQCFANSNPANPLKHGGMVGLTIRATGTYDWICDFNYLIGWHMRNVHMETSQAATGGFRSTKITPSDTSWVLNWSNVSITVPDAGTAYALDLDTSDGVLTGGNVTGGKGTILRGTGQMKLQGGRYDRSNDVGITISIETESLAQHHINGCQIDECANYGVMIDGDADDSRTSIYAFPLIVNNAFRNNGATADIYFKNATGNALRGGLISGNIHSESAVTPILYDLARWSYLTIIPGAHLTIEDAHPISYIGDQYKQSLLSVNRIAVSEGHTGDTAEKVDYTYGTAEIPANAMGIKGILKVTTLFSHTISAGTITMRVKFGGTTFSEVVASATGSTSIETIIMNRSDSAAQVGAALDSTGFGTSTNAAVTGAVDTTSAQDVLVTTQSSNAGNTAALEAVNIEITPFSLS